MYNEQQDTQKRYRRKKNMTEQETRIALILFWLMLGYSAGLAIYFACQPV